MSETKELVVIEPANVMTVFTTPEQMDPILERIFKEARSFVPDVSTDKGRKHIASVAYRVAQTKVYLDNLGKDLVTEMKKLPGVVDESRRTMRDKLDALKDEIRQPLTVWEAEQERIASEKKAEAEAAALAAEIEHCHELALLMNAEFDRAKEQARIEAERAAVEAERLRAEAEAQRIRDAEEAARKAAEAKAAADIAAAEQARRDAEIRAEAQALAAKQAADKAEADRIEAAAKAERDKLAAIEAERQRVAVEAKRIADITAKREADSHHCAKINRDALSDLMTSANISEEQARTIVKAIVLGMVRNVTISY